MKNFLFGIFLLLFARSIALANDGIAGVSAGGIVMGKTDAVAMKKEVLSISYDKISVEYDFLNETSVDVEETIFFPLPEYTAAYHHEDTYYGQPQNFVVEVDGKTVSYKTVITAKLDGKDITAELRKLGLSEQQIAYFPSFSPFKEKIKPLSFKQRKVFIDKGFLEQILGDEEWIPAWSVLVQYVWKQKFPSGKTLRVRHQYTPFASAGPAEFSLGKSFEKYYCGDKDFLKSWNRLAEKSNNTVNANRVSYILKTGNTWRNGIEDFTLNLVKKNPDELISLCFPGDFKKINATTLQAHLIDFKPKQDLEIYFGNIEDLNGTPGVKPKINQ